MVHGAVMCVYGAVYCLQSVSHHSKICDVELLNDFEPTYLIAAPILGLSQWKRVMLRLPDSRLKRAEVDRRAV